MEIEHIGQAVPSNHRIRINQGMIIMARYVSILKRQDRPKEYEYDDFELDALIMALSEAYTEKMGLGDHTKEIEAMLERVRKRLLVSYEVHDQYLVDTEELESQHPDIFDEDYDGSDEEDDDEDDIEEIDEEFDDDEEDEEDEDDYDSYGCRRHCDPNCWTSYEDAVLVKLLDDDDYIVCPEPNLRSVRCPKNPVPGICLKHLVKKGYITEYEKDIVESVTIDRVPVENFRVSFDTYDLICKNYPETIPYDRRV